jgi:YVTN family beta-propeller protein
MNRIYAVLALCLSLYACKKEETTTQPITGNPDTGFLHGVYVLNEGSFGGNNASIGYINENNTLTQDLYYDVNEVSLGDVLQSFTIIGNRGYAVLNNSQKVVVIDMHSFEHVAEISGLSYPRQVEGIGNNKALLSNGSMEGELKVIDLNTNTVTSSITVGKGPERLLHVADYVVVCNSGGWDIDSTISIIDTQSLDVAHTVVVGDRPVDAVVDRNGTLWVLCSGNTSWMPGGETAAKLVKVDTSTWAVVGTYTFENSADHPQHLEIDPNGETLYFLNGNVYATNIEDINLSVNVVSQLPLSTIHVNPATRHIWGASISDYTNPSTVYQISSTGAQLNSFVVGLGTNGVVFN